MGELAEVSGKKTWEPEHHRASKARKTQYYAQPGPGNHVTLPSAQNKTFLSTLDSFGASGDPKKRLGQAWPMFCVVC